MLVYSAALRAPTGVPAARAAPFLGSRHARGVKDDM